MMNESFYDNVDPRRKQELNDARMVREDHAKMANLPEQGYQREFNAWKNVERLAMYNQSDKSRRGE